MSERYDVVVVGGGIVGLATAISLRNHLPNAAIALVEKESELGVHQTGHNSGVLHSGLYYRPGSLKARLCVEGRSRMVEFCRAEGLPIESTGKLVVATTARDLIALEDLYERGVANGLTIERLGPQGIADHEPHAVGLAALWVPATSVVDFGLIAARLGDALSGKGVEVITDSRVDRIETRDGGVTVGAGERSFETRVVVNATGLHADRIAALTGEAPPVRIVPFRGEYHTLTEGAAGLVRGLIYPVPDPRFPFLGVHFTRGVDGSVEVGPNAVMALGREHYRGTRMEWSGLVDTFGYRGFRRLAAKHLVSGLGEMVRSRSTVLYARRARRLVPDLRARHLLRGGSGVRAQAVYPDGRLADDFVLAGDGPFVHVLSAPSPAATAALAIGDHLAAIVRERLG